MPHSQAHLQVSPANAKTKTCKRACLPQRTAYKKMQQKRKKNNVINEQRNANMRYILLPR
jgi:hypothetical protein